jgi:hypothetical protein
MKYKLKKSNELFHVLEIATDQIIKSFKDESEARKYSRSLNFGAVFDGWTPRFFLQSFQI